MMSLWGLLALACTGRSERPDIILLTVDTLRVDHVRAYNPDSPAETPAMDALAARGIRFDQAYSPISVTGPAFCSLHTGLTPGSHEVVINIFRGGTPLNPRFTTLAEHLEHNGYDTGAFVSGFTLREELGLSQGFQTYDDPPERVGSRNRTGRRTADAAIAWLGEQRGPILMWYHTFDPHGPLHRWRKSSSLEEWEKDPEKLKSFAHYQRINGISDPDFYAQRYAAAVSGADRQLQRILDALDAQGRLDNAIVILTADHGESFDERALWFDHGTTPYEEQLHVPLIFKLPGDERAGDVIDALVGLEDVAPSVVAAAGLPLMPRLEGSTGLLSGESALIRSGESSHCKMGQGQSCTPRGPGGKLYSARDATHTLIRRPLPSGISYELYDRIADPGEQRVLFGAEIPAPLKAVVDEMAAVRSRMTFPEPASASDPGENDDELEALRALGYIDPAEDTPEGEE
jgi:choline-sulfatase